MKKNKTAIFLAVSAIGLAALWQTTRPEPSREVTSDFHFSCDSSFEVPLEPKKFFFDYRQNLLSGQDNNPFRNEQIAVVLCGEKNKSFPEEEFYLCESMTRDIATMCQREKILHPLGMWTLSEKGDYVAYFIKSNPDRLCVNCDHETEEPRIDQMIFYNRQNNSSVTLSLGETWENGVITRNKER